MESSETRSDVRYEDASRLVAQPSETVIVQPANALSPNLPRKALGTITNNIVIIIGIAVVAIIVFTFALSWVDKSMPDAILVMGGVALGYLGNAIVNNNTSTG
jgi:hypothetical protein